MKITLNTERQFNYYLKLKNEKAFTFLFENYGAAINGIVRRLFPEPAVSDLVFKNTFLNICNNIHNYDQKRSPLSTWLILQTRNYLKGTVCGLSDTSKKDMSNDDIIDMSYAYTKEEISAALDVPVNDVNSMALSAISRIRANKAILLDVTL